jgi:hypothetical protein
VEEEDDELDSEEVVDTKSKVESLIKKGLNDIF